MFEKELEQEEKTLPRSEGVARATRPASSARPYPPVARTRNRPARHLYPPPRTIPRLPFLPPKPMRPVTRRRRMSGVFPISDGRRNLRGTSSSYRTTISFPRSLSRRCADRG